MTERPRKATRLTVSLEEQDYQTLSQIALSRDASVSWVIRQAIRQFIESSSEVHHPFSKPHMPRKDGDV
ncbi:ribbon-helix-helix domain-containing protein [Rhodospirillum sp. A1_3_36]|uniref:ribbon-helix-helix domain-containing protein n=1 Tax=Rhodospirillum sp. A1_3_36 TaxID=3391666 RepID=UPI0039A6F5A5